MVLLENDVALPVTDEIISHIRKDLTGSRRKIGESVDSIVTSALRGHCLMSWVRVSDLVSYLSSHEKPVKILLPV